jgi:hypothetical protein
MKKRVIIFSIFALIVSDCKLSAQMICMDRFNSYPLISAEEVARIAPAIKKWTDFYNIDLTQMRLIFQHHECFICPPDPASIYIRGFGEEEDTDTRIDVDYSPNKQRYVDLQLFWGYVEREDGKFELYGWDTGQEIYFIDRETKTQNMILRFNHGNFAEGVFWKSNDVFMIVGHRFGFGFFVSVFDIIEETHSFYEIWWEERDDNVGGFLNEVYWKERGIIVACPFRN